MNNLSAFIKKMLRSRLTWWITPLVVAVVVGVTTLAGPALFAGAGNANCPHPYAIQWGDTLAQLAKQHGTTVEALQKINKIPNPNLIFVNQQICFSTSATTFTPSIRGGATSRIQIADTSLFREYNNDAPEFTFWKYSSCNGAALTATMRAYGAYAGDIGTVLEYQYTHGLWNPAQGLIAGEAGMSQTAAHFGFKTIGHPRTLDDLKWYTDRGMPVIVGYTSGHILVVKGIDDANVYMVNAVPGWISVASRGYFNQMWVESNHFSLVIAPN